MFKIMWSWFWHLGDESCWEIRSVFLSTALISLVSCLGCWGMGWVGQHRFFPLSRLSLTVCSWCLIDPWGPLFRLQIILPVRFTHQPWGQRILARDSLHQRYPVEHSQFLCHSWATAPGELVITLILPDLPWRDICVQAACSLKFKNLCSYITECEKLY